MYVFMCVCNVLCNICMYVCDYIKRSLECPTPAKFQMAGGVFFLGGAKFFNIIFNEKQFLRVFVPSDGRTERILIGVSRGCERGHHLPDKCVDRLQGMLLR